MSAPPARLVLPGVPNAAGRTLVMGILNATPDSFSDGGRYFDADAAIERGLELVAQGADIIDVGGESTRPGAEPVLAAEEQRRVIPVIDALSREGIAISVDTIHAATAHAAVEAGALIINDVSGGLHDPDMLSVAAAAEAVYVAMHWRGVPDPTHRRSGYGDVVADVRDELARLADAALAAGVAPDMLVLDPGLGFDKTAEQGWQLLAGLSRLNDLGYPVLIGVSRKRMIAETLAAARDRPTAEVSLEDRDLGTAAVSALAADAGAWAVRVHEVTPTVNALAIAAAWQAASAEAETAAPEVAVGGAALLVAPGPAGHDRITVTGIEVFAHHGVFDFERQRGQRFLIDVELAIDLMPAAGSDELGLTVHYGELTEAVIAAVERDPVDLIETLAERVAAVALDLTAAVHSSRPEHQRATGPQLAEVRVTVHKPDAPIEATFADVSVTIVRTLRHEARS